MAADALEAVRTVLAGLPALAGVPVSIAIQGAAPQVVIAPGGGEVALSSYPGHLGVTAVLGVLGAGYDDVDGAPPDDGTVARTATALVVDIAEWSGPVVTPHGEVHALAVTAPPAQAQDPLTDRPQWDLTVTAHVML